MICTNAVRLAKINGTLDVKGHLLYGAGSTAQTPNLLTHSGMTKNIFNLPATCCKGQLVFLPADLKSSLLTQSRAFAGKGRVAMSSKQNTHKKWREVHDLTKTLTVVAKGVQKCSLKKFPPCSWSDVKISLLCSVFQWWIAFIVVLNPLLHLSTAGEHNALVSIWDWVAPVPRKRPCCDCDSFRCYVGAAAGFCAPVFMAQAVVERSRQANDS